MAGLARPNVSPLGTEAKYEIVSSNVYGKTNASSLFDGICAGGWNSENVCYWSTYNHYIIIKIFNDCNIWRCGTIERNDHVGMFNIYKLNDSNGTFEIIDIKQTVSPITEKQWEKTISNIPAGTYKFQGISQKPRLDSEWYLERLPSHMIKKDNRYYSISDNSYDIFNKEYISIPFTDSVSSFNNFILDNDVRLYDLSEERTINEETFKPINKFNNFSIIKLQ